MLKEIPSSAIPLNAKYHKYLYSPLIVLVTLSLVSCSSPMKESSAPAEHPDYPKETSAPAERDRAYPKMAAPSRDRDGARGAPVAEEMAAPAPEEFSSPAPDFEEISESVTREMEPAEMTRAAPTAARHESTRANTFDEYRVVLGADEQLKIPGIPGELRVWIGDPAYQPDMPEDMAHTGTTLPAAGEWAKVEPYAPAFAIEPKGTPCIKIHPSGSEVRFQLTPKKAGTFEVGATVYLFSTPECSGAPVPKIAANLHVTVKVDKKEVVQEKGKQLWEIFWEQLLEFWAALLVLLFGLVLFLIRGRLKKWFGYEKE